MRFYPKILVFILIAAFLAACSTAPKKTLTPLETLKQYGDAYRKKDITAMKLLLSEESLKMHEQEARAQNTTVDELRRLWRSAESLGLDWISIWEHFYAADGTGYPGGLRSRTLREQLERRPAEVLRKAVKGMLPRNRMARQQITKLKIYAGPVHPHEAQAPKTLEVE